MSRAVLRRHCSTLCALVAVFALTATRGVLAQQDDAAPRFTAVQVGVSDYYKVGHWTPIWFTIRGGNQPTTGIIELTMLDGDGEQSRYTSERPGQLLPGRESTFLIYAKPGRIYGSLSAVLRDVESGRVVARKTFEPAATLSPERPRPALLATDQLFVVLGNPVDLASASSLLAQGAGEIAVAQVDNVARLPTQWIGYAGVDAIFITTSRPEAIANLAPDSAQLAALQEWVRLGGRLVLCVGSAAAQVLAPDAPLARFAPGRFERIVPLRVMTALEAYAETTLPLLPGGDDTGDAASVDVPLLTDVEGRVEANEGELALVVRRAYGFGEVVFVAFDLDRPPFATWGARAQLTARLLGFPPGRNEESSDQAEAMQQIASVSGYDDLVGQLHSAIDEFAGVRVAPFWFVAFLAVGYILLIGPVDYFLVNKVFKRSTLTWITFPLMVVAVSVAAYALAYWMKGSQLRINQVDLVDVDLQNRSVRGTTWANVFSPRMAAYDVGLSPALPPEIEESDTQVLVSWLGVPGTGLSGMHSAAADPPLWRRSYDVAPQLDSLAGVPIQVWSTKAFQGRWIGHNAFLGDTLDARLVEVDGGLLEGTVTNQLPFRLENCLLAYRRWAYRLDTLEPGQSVDISPLRDPRTLRTELTGREATGSGGQSTSSSISLSRDVPSILRTMMFFQASGGVDYVHLLNRFHSFVDLTGQLELGRAVFVGQADTAGSELLLDEEIPDDAQIERWTFCRFLIPVTSGGADDD